MATFWDVTPYSFVVASSCFELIFCSCVQDWVRNPYFVHRRNFNFVTYHMLPAFCCMVCSCVLYNCTINCHHILKSITTCSLYLRALTFSQRWNEGSRFFGMWRCVAMNVVPDISEESVTFISRGLTRITSVWRDRYIFVTLSVSELFLKWNIPDDSCIESHILCSVTSFSPLPPPSRAVYEIVLKKVV